MKRAIIIPGLQSEQEYYDAARPSSSNDHWYPWLQKQLQLADLDCQTPEIFNGWKLSYEDWLREFERFGVDTETSLIGHSCGGGFIVRWLSEHPDVRVDKVVLVAPWMNTDKEFDTPFFDFDIDANLADRTKDLTIYVSDDEPHASVKETVQLLKEKLHEVKVKEFQSHGHFTVGSMGTVEFPELRDHLLGAA